nr:thermostable direct hemolysin-family toxin [Vibrio parahaemolyticus]
MKRKPSKDVHGPSIFTTSGPKWLASYRR